MTIKASRYTVEYNIRISDLKEHSTAIAPPKEEVTLAEAVFAEELMFTDETKAGLDLLLGDCETETPVNDYMIADIGEDDDEEWVFFINVWGEFDNDATWNKIKEAMGLTCDVRRTNEPLERT